MKDNHEHTIISTRRGFIKASGGATIGLSATIMGSNLLTGCAHEQNINSKGKKIKGQFEHEMLGHYQAYIRGLSTLNNLERNLFHSFERIEKALEGESEHEYLRLYASQFFKVTNTTVEETINSFNVLRNYVEGRIHKTSDFISVLEEAIPNDSIKEQIIFMFRKTGGVSNLFEEQSKRYEIILNAYSEISSRIDYQDSFSFVQALDVLREYYETLEKIKGEFLLKLKSLFTPEEEERIKKWKKKFEDAKKKGDKNELDLLYHYICNQERPEVRFEIFGEDFDCCKIMFCGTADMPCWHWAVCIAALVVLACIRWC